MGKERPDFSYMIPPLLPQKMSYTLQKKVIGEKENELPPHPFPLPQEARGLGSALS
jgi:hypothetical protein